VAFTCLTIVSIGPIIMFGRRYWFFREPSHSEVPTDERRDSAKPESGHRLNPLLMIFG
jgi:hypothetical protein